VAQALAVHRAGLPNVHCVPGATPVRVWLAGRCRYVGLCGRGTSAAAQSRATPLRARVKAAQGGALPALCPTLPYPERALGRRRTRATWRGTCRRGRRPATRCAGCSCGPRPWRAPRGPPPWSPKATRLQEPHSPPCCHACRSPSWLELSVSPRCCKCCLAAWLPARAPVRSHLCTRWLCCQGLGCAHYAAGL